MRPRTGIILAGGDSTRMKAIDKAEVRIGAKRLIDIVHDRIRVQCDEIMISASHDYGLGLSAIKDDPAHPGGPAGGILSVATVLNARSTPPEGFFTVPVDGPNLPARFCEIMYNREATTLAEDTSRTHPSFAWWRLTDLNLVLRNHKNIESLSLHKLARLCQARPVMWAEPDLFFNINTANDFSNYLTPHISPDND